MTIIITINVMIIKLNETQINQATEIALLRNNSQREAKRKDGLVKGSSLDRDIQGSLAELAVSAALNLPWDGKFLPISVWDTWKLEGNDVGKLEVRSTDRPNGRLILHHSDKDYSPYILVISEDMINFQLIGWIYGKDGKQKKYWRSNVPRPCYMVPQNNLSSIQDLIKNL